jgi:Zn-finger nucleic acid-binding protein
VPGGKVEQVGDSDILYSLLARDIEEDDAAACRCPNGHGILVRARAELVPPIRLDRCETCHGLWFDRGEWQELANSHLVDHLEDLWSKSAARKQRLERSQRRYRQWAKEQFGSDLMDRMLAVAEELKNHPSRAEALAFIREMSAEDEQA